ncbi:MAG: hypothetical protein HY925_03675 [Elusimicrobia bacterium]|nr:hypothetical protein [Elusimicrobiota bacterium]
MIPGLAFLFLLAPAAHASKFKVQPPEPAPASTDTVIVAIPTPGPAPLFPDRLQPELRLVPINTSNYHLLVGAALVRGRYSVDVMYGRDKGTQPDSRGYPVTFQSHRYQLILSKYWKDIRKPVRGVAFPEMIRAGVGASYFFNTSQPTTVRYFAPVINVAAMHTLYEKLGAFVGLEYVIARRRMEGDRELGGPAFMVGLYYRFF